jgi:hypothetical protein
VRDFAGPARSLESIIRNKLINRKCRQGAEVRNDAKIMGVGWELIEFQSIQDFFFFFLCIGIVSFLRKKNEKERKKGVKRHKIDKKYAE